VIGMTMLTLMPSTRLPIRMPTTRLTRSRREAQSTLKKLDQLSGLGGSA
jgi:hypothetical protein